MREDRVDELALPLALDPLVLDEVRLTTHPELLQYAGRASVARLETSDHAVQPDDLEGIGEHRPRRFRRVAVSLMRAVEDEAELALAVCDACPEKRDVADELSRGPKLDGGAQPLAFGPKRAAGRLEREELTGLSERSRVVVEPARVRLVAVDRMQCLEVLGQEGTEQEPRSLDRPGGLVHGVTVREGF